MALEVSDKLQAYKTRETKYVKDFSESGSKKKVTLEEIYGDYIVHKKRPKPRQTNQLTKQTTPKRPQNLTKPKHTK